MNPFFHRLLILAAGLILSTAAAASPTVEIQTSMGKVVIELDSEKAPVTVKNFLQYAKDGFYNGTIFHRVMDGFMIQGGGFTETMMRSITPRAMVGATPYSARSRRAWTSSTK